MQVSQYTFQRKVKETKEGPFLISSETDEGTAFSDIFQCRLGLHRPFAPVSKLVSGV